MIHISTFASIFKAAPNGLDSFYISIISARLKQYVFVLQYYPCIEISIKQNRNVNADCRVHGLYITGFRPNPLYSDVLLVSPILYSTVYKINIQIVLI